MKKLWLIPAERYITVDVAAIEKRLSLLQQGGFGMNERVRSHFDEIEARLIECPVILSYEITRRDISPAKDLFFDFNTGLFPFYYIP